MPVRERMPAAQPVAPNRTGLPDGLKAGLETLSGFALDNVRVHYASPQPAQLQAHAFAQGTNIHVAPGQESHVPHEAWHVVQQMQRRVPVTRHAGNGTPINDDVHLEREADFMGAKAALNATAGKPPTPLRQAVPFGPAQLGRKTPKKQRTGKEEDTAEEIQALLDAKIAETAEDEPPVLTAKEEARVLRFLQNASGALSGPRRIKATLRGFMLAEKGPLSRLVNDLRGDEKPKKPKKTKAVQNDEDDGEPPNLFDNEDSESSDNEEIPMTYLRQNFPNAFQPVADHSRADKKEGEFLDASNTNLLLFLDGSLIPRNINGKPNTGAVRKRKHTVSQKLQDDEDRLRAKQESFYFGSHLPTDQKGTQVTDESIKRVKKGTDKAQNPALHRLLTYTLPGFAQEDSHTHGEQSVLRSQVWDSLVQKVVNKLIGLMGGEVNEEEELEVTTISLVLNRSSCVDCARAMSVAVVVFWEEVARASGLGDAQTARDALGDYVRFVARFPTVYKHKKERKKKFQNLDTILKGLHEAGWQIEPFKPAIEGGLESHEDLVDRVAKARGEEDAKEDYDDEQAIYDEEDEEELSDDDSFEEEEEAEEDGPAYRLLRANNCLLRAMNNGANLDPDTVTAIRARLFHGGHADYGEYVEANEESVGVIAEILGITQTIVHVINNEDEGELAFEIDHEGNVAPILDLAEIAGNEYDGFRYLLIDYAGEHFEDRSHNRSVRKQVKL